MRSQQEKLSPFDYLLALNESILSSARSLPQDEKTRKEWVGVSFLSGNHVLLVELHEVIEMMRVRLMFHLPAVKPWLRGMAASHGEIFPVTDLFAFLTKKLSTITHQSRILVIE